MADAICDDGCPNRWWPRYSGVVKARSGDATNQAKTVAGSVRRASKAIVWRTSKGKKTGNVTGLVGATRANRKAIVKPSKLASVSVIKSADARGAAKGLKPVAAKKPRRVLPLVEQIKAPMTRAEARRMTQRLQAPNRPTRKLPPRP